MNHSIRITALAALAVLAAPFLRAAEAEYPGLEGIPEIVADVDGKPIRRLELMRELVGSSGARALERLVHRLLVEQIAAEQKIVVTDQDIEMQYKIDKNELAGELVGVENPKAPTPMEDIVRAKCGMSVAEYKNIVIRQRLLSRRSMAADIMPSNEELRKFFDDYPEMFQEPIRYRAAHILISPLDPRDIHKGGQAKSTFGQMLEYEKLRQLRIDRERDEGIKFAEAPTEEINDGWRESRIQAERLTQELQAYPARWNDYVRRFSRDPMDQMPIRKAGSKLPVKTKREELHLSPGEVGEYHKRGPMVKEFYEGTKNLKVGQIGGPIQTQFGWHIVKMLDIKFPPVVTFAQCKEKVRRLFIENEIQLRSDSWLAQLAARADLKLFALDLRLFGALAQVAARADYKADKATLWPPKAETQVVHIGLVDINGEHETPELDPIVGTVNGVAIKRSEVWHELLRTEGSEALTRLINREVVLTILKDKGVPYMEWLCSDPKHRSPTAPAPQSIRIKEEAMQRELNDERIEFDKLIAENKEYANLTFPEFIFRKFGQSEDEYRRAIEASLILRTAIRRKVVPADEREFERTLKFEFAMARDQYGQSPWFEISHILIVPAGGMLRADAAAKITAKQIADNIATQYLAKPESWAQLVEQYSDDTPENKANHGKLSGCYSDFTPPDVPESLQFYREIKETHLEAGMATPPLKSARGYHIVRLDRKHGAQQAEFGEKRKQIEKDYINEQAKYYADVWLRALNSRAIVKHYLYKPTLVYEAGDIPDNFPIPKD